MSSKPRIITARVAADLIDKVYAAEGWTKLEGEVRSRRVKALYDLSVDSRGGFYIATRREEPAAEQDTASTPGAGQ